MSHVQQHLELPERRVCRVLGQARSTQRYAAVPRDGDEALIRRMHDLVRQQPRRGYRMTCGMLRLDGWRINVKRVYRLWTQEGFKVPGKQHKNRRLGHSANGILHPQRRSRNREPLTGGLSANIPANSASFGGSADRRRALAFQNENRPAFAGR